MKSKVASKVFHQSSWHEPTKSSKSSNGKIRISRRDNGDGEFLKRALLLFVPLVRSSSSSSFKNQERKRHFPPIWYCHLFEFRSVAAVVCCTIKSAVADPRLLLLQFDCENVAGGDSNNRVSSGNPQL